MPIKRIIAAVIIVLIIFWIVVFVLRLRPDLTTTSTPPSPTPTPQPTTRPPNSTPTTAVIPTPTPIQALIIGYITEIVEPLSPDNLKTITLNNITTVFLRQNTQILDQNNNIADSSCLQIGQTIRASGAIIDNSIKAQKIIIESICPAPQTNTPTLIPK